MGLSSPLIFLFLAFVPLFMILLVRLEPDKDGDTFRSDDVQDGGRSGGVAAEGECGGGEIPVLSSDGFGGAAPG